MSEEWRIIADFPDYAVSSFGRVKRVKPDRHGRMNVVMLTPVMGNHGYLIVSLHRNANQSVKTLHRLVCTAFHGPAPSEKHHAAHRDGDRASNCASNLRWATPSENNMDKHKHGTMRCGARHHARAKPECMPRGIRHGNAKLNDAAVIAIRADRRPQSAIAADHGVSQSLISYIKRGIGWAHVIQPEQHQ